MSAVAPLGLHDCCGPCGGRFQAGTVVPVDAVDLQLARDLGVCAPCFVPFAAKSREVAARILAEPVPSGEGDLPKLRALLDGGAR